jgi:hypothetical protein
MSINSPQLWNAPLSLNALILTVSGYIMKVSRNSFPHLSSKEAPVNKNTETRSIQAQIHIPLSLL